MILVLCVKMLKCSERIGVDNWNWSNVLKSFNRSDYHHVYLSTTTDCMLGLDPPLNKIKMEKWKIVLDINQYLKLLF